MAPGDSMANSLAPMQVPFELSIGLRYTRAGRRSGRRNGFISFISALSVAGIALGVAALITVLSVMNGFQKEVRDRMLGVLSHIEVIQPGANRLPGIEVRAVRDYRGGGRSSAVITPSTPSIARGLLIQSVHSGRR